MFKERIKKIYISRLVLWDMAIKQLKAKYAGSKLGIWWAIVTPLILAVSINFVFTIVFKIDIPNYTLFVLAGIIPWFFLTNALSEVTNSFVVNTSILKQSVLPREFIPVSNILTNLLNFLIGLIFLLPLFVILNFKVIQLLQFLLIVIMLHFLFIIGLGFLFSTLNVFFRDLSHFLTTAFMVWFWITPVFYSLEMIPFPFRWICIFNPASHFVILYQKILFQTKTPSFKEISTAFCISLVSFVIGYVFFVRKESMLLKRI